MYKIAITGKANSGKDTVGKIISKFYNNDPNIIYGGYTQKIALANPVKEMARIMYPDLPKKLFYGPSALRMTEIPGSLKDGKPLTVRQLLIDIGTNLGRKYDEKLWLNVFDHTLDYYNKRGCGLLIVTDVRFRNEFDHIKNKGFFTIRLVRNDYTKIDNVSETDQDGITDSEFDYVLNNINQRLTHKKLVNLC